MAYFLFDDAGLITIVVGCFLGGFLPPLIMILRCPEARAFIKAQVSGGVVICSSDDAGTSFEIARPFGSHGQYISGKNQFGQRKIYVHPKLETSAFTRSFILKGIRRPIFFHGGRTVIVNPNVLKAIAVADGKKEDLPDEVKAWAQKNGVHFPGEEDKELVDSHEGLQRLKEAGKLMFVNLFALNPRRLQWYFKDHYDEGQYDVLLEQSRQAGFNEGPGSHRGGGGKNKVLLAGLLIFIVMIIIGVAGLALGVKF